MTNKDKTAIENLLIIARYMQENSILTSKDEGLLRQSIRRAQVLIGVQVTPGDEVVELGDITELNVDSLVKALKRRKKS